MSAELLRKAAEAERANWGDEGSRHPKGHGAVHLAIADVLEVLAYVKEHEGECDYMRTVDPDPSVTLARLIVGEQS